MEKDHLTGEMVKGSTGIDTREVAFHGMVIFHVSANDEA